MAAIEHEFYRSWRGPTPTDVDCWRLVFDPDARRLFIRHEWETTRHSGTDEFEIDEFLIQEGAPQAALIDRLRSMPTPNGPKRSIGSVPTSRASRLRLRHHWPFLDVEAEGQTFIGGKGVDRRYSLYRSVLLALTSREPNRISSVPPRPRLAQMNAIRSALQVSLEATEFSRQVCLPNPP